MEKTEKNIIFFEIYITNVKKENYDKSYTCHGDDILIINFEFNSILILFNN